MTTATDHLRASSQPSTPARRQALPVTLAAIGRSTRAMLRSPTTLVAPLAQSLFFLIVYAGQLGVVGRGYLAGDSFISFLLPLILLTGAATGAGAAGKLLLSDIESGYLDRLRLAHGSTAPFYTGPVVAALVAVAIQAAVTVLGACVVGFQPTSWAGTGGMALVILALSIGIALLSIAVAIRTASASATGLVPLVVFGLSFFTGFFAPVDELSPWMRAAATVNPLSYVIDATRQLESGSALTAMPVALAVLGVLMIVGIAACTVASNHARRNR